MPTTLAHLLVRLGVDAKEFGTKMRAAERTLKDVGQGMSKVGSVLSVGVTAPMLAVAGASLKMAMDAVESENLFTVAMGGMANAARKWSDEVSTALGLNAYAVRQNVATFQQMFTAMGLGEAAAYDMSKGLTQLAYDMASFFNMSPEEAFEKLQAGITGEGEALKRLGILVDETTIKQVAWAHGIASIGQELTQQEKVQARYLTIMQQTAKAQGDLARTMDSPTNQLRRLRAQAEEVAIEFGQALLPIIEDLQPAFKQVGDMVKAAATAFSRMTPENQKLTVQIAAMVAVLGPLLKLTSPLVGATASIARMWSHAAIEARKLIAAKKAAVVASGELIVANRATEVSSAAWVTRMGHAKVATVGWTSVNYKLATSFKVLWASALGPIVAVALLAWELGSALRPLVNQIEGIAELFGLIANKSQDLGDALVKNKDQFADAFVVYQKMREQLGFLGDEWDVGTTHTEANSRALSDNMARLIELQNAQLGTAKAIRETTAARMGDLTTLERMAAKVALVGAAYDNVTDDLKKMYGVMDRQDIVDQMSQLVADFTLLGVQGVPAQQLMDAFGPKVTELAEAAKDYTDLDIPKGFADLQYAIEKKAVYWVGDLAKRLSQDVPDAAGLAATALESTIGQAMVNAREGASEEVTAIRNLLLELAGEEYKLKVTLDMNSDEILRRMKELGLVPNTTGSAP
ncbi:MAG TPA: hypothetical protein PKJ99_12200 [Thermoanaerobaculales bacterium]|nr:hypothetical protein [Thermoanaerobaculales bacterium]HQL30857.1 hypothetical protein [Thermoanaerobaculales bacterium]